MSRAGEVESVPPRTLRCLLISDTRLEAFRRWKPYLVQFLTGLFLNPEVETEEGRARLGFIAIELALFELFLRNNSRNSRDRQVFWLFLVFLSMEEALFRITITSANFLQNWFGLRFCLAMQINKT